MKTTVEMRAIALLIPGYAAKMPREKIKLVNRPSQAAPVEETPESMVELHNDAVVAVIRDVVSKLNRRRLQLHSDVVRDVFNKLNLKEFNYLPLA